MGRTRSVAALVLALLALGAALTAQGSPAATVDPAAIKALEGMSSYLRSLKAFQVQSVSTTDEVLEDGQTVKYAAHVNFLVQRPNKLMADVTSDRRDRRFLYDGKTFTLYARRAGYYASVPAPATLHELDEILSEKYAIDLPLADLFRFGSPPWNASVIKSAIDVGPSSIDGTSCRHYAFRQDGADFQIWIQLGDHPLPRKLVITTTDDQSRPQYMVDLTWNLAPAFNEQAFTFVPPAGAQRVAFAAAK